jgi:glycosidase
MIHRCGFLLLLQCTAFLAAAQDSVDVTFRYTNPAISQAWLVGEFNNWNNQAWQMTSAPGGLWTYRARLPVGGNPNPPSVGVPGAWQFKFYYTGAGQWPGDPLDHHVNQGDNGDSFIYIKDPTIYQLRPNGPAITAPSPVISAFLFPKVGASVDTSALLVTIDGTGYPVPGSAYDSATSLLAWAPPPLPNGTHSVILSARSTGSGTNADTVSFTSLQTTFVTITTHGGYATRNPLRTVRGIVVDTSVHRVSLVRNNRDTIIAPVTSGAFSVTDTLLEGRNTFRALADSAGATAASDSVTFTLFVNHAPDAEISFTDIGSSIIVSAGGSTDPDSGQSALLTSSWSADHANPAPLAGVDGASARTLTVPKPSKAGEYYLGLVARDPDGNADTTRNYFTLRPDRSVIVPGYASNPGWAKEGRIYFLFPLAASAAGTINGAADKLQYIHDMGFSIVWMMPVMTNAARINNGSGPGYNIVDFYTVAPEYGTNQDFKAFIAKAHLLGLKVILDVTPNHSSWVHPWSVDAHQFHQDSRYWSWYEHTIIPHNDNGLGQSLDADGFAYYSGFSSQLLDLNWTDPDMRAEMINAYKYWIRETGLDGYRFDVYWGPHRRYGEAFMGRPVRQALKHIKPDILLLGEDDGTGGGTESIYADYTGGTPGGLDAAYDFKLYFNQIRGFGFTPGAVNSLHTEIDNSGFYPGPDALYMRFMESQDEDRITYFYSGSFALDAATTFQRTMPVASVIFTAPGIPMLWNGQEVGWGYGINGSKDARVRSLINWNYPGKTLLTPHYQKLAWIRATFPAFSQHKRDTNGDGAVNASDSSDFVRVASSDGNLYAFLRPYADQNGLTVVNVSGGQVSATLNLAGAGLRFTGTPPASLFLNDVYANTRLTVNTASLAAFPVNLAAYGTAVYTASITMDSLKIDNPLVAVPESRGIPGVFALDQNYPNPFNPNTVLGFELPETGRVRLAVYDILGREVAVLVDGVYPAGRNTVTFDGTRLASGVYLCRLSTLPLDARTSGITSGPGGTGRPGGLTAVRKMILIR